MSHRPGRHQRKPSQGVFINFGSLPTTLVTSDNNAGAAAPTEPAALPMTPRAAPPVAAQPPLLAPASAQAPKPATLKENAARDGAAKAKDPAD